MDCYVQKHLNTFEIISGHPANPKMITLRPETPADAAAIYGVQQPWFCCEAWMALGIIPDALAGMRGRVYPAAFAGV